MEAAFILFVMMVLGGMVLVPIVAIVLAARARSRATAAEIQAKAAHEALSEIKWRLVDAERRSKEMDERLSTWIAHVQKELAHSPAPVQVDAPATAPATATETHAAPVVTDAAVPAAARAAAPAPAPFAPASTAAPPPAPAIPTAAPRARSRYRDIHTRDPEPPSEPPASPPPPPTFDWERLVGVRLFAWIGGGALFLAAALFLHYSIQQNLIAPPVRVAIGLGVGALALGGGDRLRERTRVTGEAISGAGVAILYAALFAARVLYDLVPLPVAFGGMALVTVTAGVIAVGRNAFFVALLGLLGGMATPYLLSSGTDRPIALFAWVALLAVGVVVVARLRSWPSLALIGLVSSVVVFAGWSSKYLTAARVPYALGAVALVVALFAFVQVNKATSQEPVDRTEPLRRLLAGIATLVPLFTASAFSSNPELDVEPLVLAVYLLIVSAGAWLADQKHANARLPVVAALLSVLCLVNRVDVDLFPAERALTLASFALVPIGYFAAWLVRRAKPDEPSVRAASIVTCVGAVPVVFLIAAKQPSTEPIAAVLGYAGVHALGLVAMGAITRQGFLLVAAQGVSFLSLAVLVHEDTKRLVEYVVPVALSGVVFWSLPLTSERLRTDRIAWWSSAAALPLHFLLVYWLTRTPWDGGPLGGLAVLCAVLTAISLRFVQRDRATEPEGSTALVALFGGLTLGFVTASVPLLLENEWLTLSWAAEVAALAWLRRRVPHGGLLMAAALLAAAVTVRLIFNPAVWDYHPRTATPIFNFYLYTFGVPALLLLLAQRLLRGDELANRHRLPGALAAISVVILFVLVNVEIADFYSVGPEVRFRLSGGGLAEDMTYSLAWGAFGIALLVVGMTVRNRPARIGALAVLVLTVGKVFLHDLWALGSLYRVGSIVGLAVALLGVSFLTQRFVLPKEQQ